MNPTSSARLNSIAADSAASEVHVSSPTLARLHKLLPRVESVCDLASGAGHTGLNCIDRKSLSFRFAVYATVAEFGIEYVTRQCEELIRARMPGVHFYTLNKAVSTVRILKNLSLAQPGDLSA